MNKKYNAKNIYKTALRRSFIRSPIAKEIKEKAVLKDKKGMKGGKVVECFYCQTHLPQYKSELDHVECVVPVYNKVEHMSFREIYRRIFYPDIEPKVCCKDCHKKKTNEEKKARKWWRNNYKYIVYKTTNMENGKIYIGAHKTKSIEDNYLGSGKLIKEDVKKYGRDIFKKDILFIFPVQSKADEMEKKLIPKNVILDDKYYNIVEGGKNRPWPKEIREHQSESKKGLYEGEKNPNYGKKHPEEIREKIGQRDYPVGSDHARAISVVCYETGEIFESMSDTGFNPSKIRRAIKTGGCCGGYHWYIYGVEEIPEFKPCKKIKRPVRCIETGKEFSSGRAAGVYMGSRDGTHILAACKGEKRKAFNFTWEFIYDDRE